MLAVGCCTVNSTSNKLLASAHSNKRLLFFRVRRDEETEEEGEINVVGK